MLDDIDEPIAPWDGRRVPVTLVGGYLGAGKTTALNALLAATDRPVAVLVNDVGEINLDARLVAKRSGDTVELTDGCVCCSMSEGLLDAFETLRARPHPPDHVLIELSGIADPTRVLPHAASLGFRLDGVAVLIDAPSIAQQLEDDRIAPLVARQINAADVALLTKTDGLAESEVDDARRVVNAVDDALPVHAAGDPGTTAALIGAATRRPGGVADTRAATLFDPHRVSNIAMPTAANLKSLTQAVENALTSHPDDVVRAKGVASLLDGTLVLVQVVGRRYELVPLPAAEDEPPTDLVVIALPR